MTSPFTGRSTPKSLSSSRTTFCRVEGQPFFRYLKESDLGVDSIADGLLPLAHTVPIHGSPADTGRASLVDSIRAVRVTVAATNGKVGELERTSQVTRIIRMPNMGFGMLEICGSPPILGTGLTATLAVAATGEPIVTLTWGKATDEDGGENDIVRYVIWRKEPGITEWEEPYLSIPAGETNYIYKMPTSSRERPTSTPWRLRIAPRRCHP